MNRPSGPNSSSWAAAAPNAGPLTLPRDNTKMCFFEFTATPVASPKYKLAGSFNTLGTDSYDITGTCCASAGPLNNAIRTSSQAIIIASLSNTAPVSPYAGAGALSFHYVVFFSACATVAAQLISPIALGLNQTNRPEI